MTRFASGILAMLMARLQARLAREADARAEKEGLAAEAAAATEEAQLQGWPPEARLAAEPRER